MVEYVNQIVVSYIQEKRQVLNLSANQPALVLFDVFKGQCQEEIFQILEDNNIYYVIIPANCTDQLQPLDLSVNKPAKDSMKPKFQMWYGDLIYEQLQQNISEPVNMHLSVMKPLSAHWIIDTKHRLHEQTDCQEYTIVCPVGCEEKFPRKMEKVM